MNDYNKFVGLLKSRKFWASVIGLVVALGFLEGGQEAQVVEALVVLGTAATYVIGTAIEDAGRGGSQ